VAELRSFVAFSRTAGGWPVKRLGAFEARAGVASTVARRLYGPMTIAVAADAAPAVERQISMLSSRAAAAEAVAHG
jgi:hypothetical protein